MKEGTMKFLISTLVLLLAFSVVATPFLIVEKVNATEEAPWTTIAPLPESSHNIGAAAVNGKIYLIGWSTCEKYDPETNNWTQLAPPPITNTWGSVVACQNKIYLIGGAADLPTQVYDPITDTWENKTSIPTTRSSLQANVVNGKIYLIGGQMPAGLYIINASISNDVYDPETDTWTQMAPIPTAVMGYASAVFEDKIYIISGGNESGPDYKPTNLVQIFDPEANQWTNGTHIPTGVCSSRACATTGLSAPKRIYVIGGTTDYYPRWATYNVINLTQIYDPETETWTTGTPILTPRCSFAIAVVNDEIYAIGGVKDEEYLIVNEKYTPSGYIPEFPSWAILPLVLTIPLFSVIIKIKMSKKRENVKF
jgi:N-acetylneuraminic acid mutarotase